MNIKNTILEFMHEQAYKPMSFEELAEAFKIMPGELKDFRKVLKTMEKEGLIYRTRTDRYGIPEKMNLVTGKLQVHPRGYGFVIPDEDVPDVFIISNNMSGAMNGDKVVAKILKEENEGKKCEGEIIKILERANKTIIGTYEDSKNFGFVVAEDKRISQDIFIPKDQKNGARTGQIVIAEITQWPDKRRNPEGNIIQIIGNKGDKGIDILTIIKKYGLPEEFPEKVLHAAENIEEEISPEELKGREDLRGKKIVTIDGEDAKDLDDAVSVEILPNGNFMLGVHIADVSHYVKEKSAIDKEALKRGNSVYLIDRVIPMLPRRLSNGICSLNPKVDRLTLSCFMEIDNTGKVVDHRISETVIKSSERMTYTNVTKILRDNDEELMKRYDYLLEDFRNMEKLSRILSAKRAHRGAVDFEFEECKIILDENGRPIEIKPYERAIANRIIEEFMLVCNETIAEHMYWTNVPFVYRIHENPNEEKIEHFIEFVHNLGYFIRRTKEIHPKVYQEVLEKVKGKKEETVVSTLLLRSMMQARYSPESVGHFGLAAKFYCHFTSPIRRYPDLIIHRIIKEFINGKITEKRQNALVPIVDFAAKQSSETERTAQDAEREVDDLKKAEYMNERIGEVYDGIISSVTGFGIFVELPNTIEGMIRLSELTDDYYVFDEKHLCLIGERTKKVYKLGDEARVKVERVDLDLHEVYFSFVDIDNDPENPNDTPNDTYNPVIINADSDGTDKLFLKPDEDAEEMLEETVDTDDGSDE